MKCFGRCFHRKKLIHALGLCAVLWLLLILYTYTSLDITVENVWNGILRRSLDEAKLRELMTSHQPGRQVVRNALEDIILRQEDILTFYHLPRRQYEASFTEITSANRDTDSPLAPDFTFHISYSETDVVLYEDYGSGCVYRIFLYPNLPTDANALHKVTSKDLKDSFLMMNVDGRHFWFSLQQVLEANQWPFLFPINSKHEKPSSGIGSYTPFCYQKSMIISYHPQRRLPTDLFKHTVNCSLNNLLCPVHIYSGISRHKFPAGTPVQSFTNEISTIKIDHKKATEISAMMLTKPELHGPDSGETCMLNCVEVCNGCRRMLYRTDQPGVIAAIKLRVYDTSFGMLLNDWTQILITFQFDNALNPQIDRVPIGSLFGVTGSMNSFRGATVGHMPRRCGHTGTVFDLPRLSMTGYMYFSMPFWQSAVVYIEGAENLDTSQLLCFQFTVVENFYDEYSTGYFHAHKTYYNDVTNGVRNILSLKGTWGSIVGLFMEIDNLYANRQVSVAQRWGLLQADHVLFLDHSRAASMLGTGLEDYFSYAHGFSMAENTSYSFVGVHHTAPLRKEPLTWHCYRLHILDPIVFHDSVDFVMEGTEVKNFSPEQQLTYEEHWNRRNNEQSVLSHLVFYYAKHNSGLNLSDSLQLTDTQSEQLHQYKCVRHSEAKSDNIFSIKNKRHLGQILKNEVYSVKGRVFAPGDVIQFTMKIKIPTNKGAFLRREFYSVKGEWNERAFVRVNGEDIGHWFIPMGTLSDEYALREDDFPLHINLTSYQQEINFEISPLTQWRDIAYGLYILLD